jgi:outer membrane protein assembly factor BamA
MLGRVFWILAGFIPLAQAQQAFPLETISAEGVAVPPSILTKLCGLKPGDQVDEAAFRAAAQRLQQTGLFAEVQYRYTPGPKKIGYSLILSLRDQPEKMTALFDFPGKDEEPIRACVKEQFPWLSNQLPTAGTAQDFLTHVTEACVGGKIPVVVKMEQNLASHRMQLVFQPRDLPKVSALEFSGTQKLPVKTVHETLAVTAMNSAYTERRFRELLELNLRPFYERYGLLNVKFPSVTFAPAGSGVTVTTAIDEGVVYSLATVSIEGPELPADVSSGQGKFKLGKVVAWPEILQSIENLEQPLRKTGYIATRSSTKRMLDDSSASLALTVHVEKGRQYFFNALSIEGAGSLTDRIRKMWKLPDGAPMDQPYMTEFHKSLFKMPELKDAKIEVGMKPLDGNKVDVVVVIK